MLCSRKEVKDSSGLVAADTEDLPMRDLSGDIALKAKDLRIDSIEGKGLAATVLDLSKTLPCSR